MLNADKFNKFFATVGEKTLEGIKITNKHSREFLSKTKGNEKSFWLTPVSEQEVTKIIKSLKSKYTKDVYDMSTSFLKQIILEIVQPITMLINKCFMDGYFPDELKVAKVIPVLKEKGKEEDYNAFRPISVLKLL